MASAMVCEGGPHAKLCQTKSLRFIQNVGFLGLILLQVHTVISLNSKYTQPNNIVTDNKVDFNGKGKLKYVWGDALADPKALGPDGHPYPW